MDIFKINKSISTTHTDNMDIFESKGQGLYAWVYESQYKIMKHDGNDPIKFGQYGTNKEGGGTPQDTILSYSAHTDHIIILWAIKLSEKELSEGKTAYKIEKLMQGLLGERKTNTKSKEVFYTSVDEIKEAYSKVMFGKYAKENYSLRPRQKEAVDSIVKAYNQNSSDFLLAALMRFGKNFTFLNAVHKICQPGDIVPILTNKPGTFDSLKKDIDRHVYFNDWDYIELKENKEFVPNPSKITIVAISKQLTDNKISRKKVRDWLKQYSFKIAMLDECHSGIDTKIFKELLDTLSIRLKVWVSGTPFKALASGKFKENCYIYNYSDQQKDKKLGLDPKAVTLELYIPELLDELKTNINYTVEEGFTFEKFFAIDKNGELVYGGDVYKFFETILNVKQPRAKFSPYRKINKLNHTIWLLPKSIEKIEVIGKLLKEIVPDVGIIIATGNNSKNINDVHNAIKKYDKTITLTNSRFVEGTTVEEWTGAFIMSDTKSLELYFQIGFRPTTPSKDKDKGYIIDFNPSRAFEMIWEMARDQASITGQDYRVVLKELLENFNVYQAGNGPEFIKTEVDQILSHINSGDYRAASLLENAQRFINVEALSKNLNTLNLNTLNLSLKSSKKISFDFINNQLNGRKNYVIEIEKNEDVDNFSSFKDKTELKKTIENIIKILSQFPLMAEIYEVKDVDSILEVATEEEIQDALKVSKSTISDILNTCVDKKEINLYL